MPWYQQACDIGLILTEYYRCNTRRIKVNEDPNTHDTLEHRFFQLL